MVPNSGNFEVIPKPGFCHNGITDRKKKICCDKNCPFCKERDIGDCLSFPYLGKISLLLFSWQGEGGWPKVKPTDLFFKDQSSFSALWISHIKFPTSSEEQWTLLSHVICQKADSSQKHNIPNCVSPLRGHYLEFNLFILKFYVI